LSEIEFASGIVLWKAVLLTAISFAVGILGGFVGLALGTIRLPAMLLLGMSAPIAGGTNILVSGLACLSGSIRHLREGRVNVRIVLVMGIPAFVGAFIGGFLSDVAPEGILILLAGLLVFWQGIEFLIMARERRREGATNTNMFGGELSGSAGMFTPGRMSAEAGIGLGVGLLGGAVGLILGSIRLPALIRILQVDPRIAAGTNLFIGMFIGAFGWVGHVLQGEVDYVLLVLMGGAAMIGSYYGAKLTGKVQLTSLILAMGLVLLAVGAILTVRGATDVF
jgi:uncharacterized membrane protein YfcA